MKTLLCVLVTLLFFACGRAEAHDWYPNDCCNARDCYEISASEIEMLPSGAYRIKATSEIFSPPGSNISLSHYRFSPDGNFHRCSWNAAREATSICLFIPQPNS